MLFALQRCLCYLFGLPPPASGSASFLVVPSSLDARTSALHWSSGHGSPLCSSTVPSPSWGVPLGGPRPCQVGAPPSRPSPLFPLFSPLPSPPPPLSLARPLTAALLLRCSALVFPVPGLYLARSHVPLGLSPVFRPVGRLGRPPQIPLGGTPPSSAPASLPSISSLMVGRGGRYGSMRVIGMVVLCARRGVALCRCWPPASPSSRAALSLWFSCFFPLVASLVALIAAHAPCVCPLLLSAFPLPRRRVPSPLVTPFLPSSPPIGCHSDGPVCTFLSAVSAVAEHSPTCATRGFYLCPILLSPPFPLVSGRTLNLPTLTCYCPRALCCAPLPRLSPHPGRHGFTMRGSVDMRTGLRSCLWTD